MRVVHIPVTDIKMGERFRKEHGNIKSLAAAIKERGLLQPITIDKVGNLVAGGRRFTAVRELGWKKIPALIMDVVDEVDAREIELMENIQRLDMTWDERALLERRIFDLKAAKDPDWTMDKQSEATGKSRGGISRRLHLAKILDVVPELSEYKTEDEAWKQYKKLEERAVVQQLRKTTPIDYKGASKNADKHFIVGDTLVELARIKGGKIGFAEVDPPYAIQLDKRKGQRNLGAAALHTYNEMDADDYPAAMRIVAAETYRMLRKDAFCVWWFGYPWYDLVKGILEEAGFKVNPIPAIWVKNQAGQTASPDTMLGSAYEPFFICRKGQPKMVNAGRSNVFDFKPVAPQKKIHPTEKPIELLLAILDTFVWPGSMLVVPFLGSGVTLRAAYQRDLYGFGYDLDEMNKRLFLDAVYKDDLRRDQKEKDKEKKDESESR